MDAMERKLDEAYRYMKPYMDRENAPELIAMCKCCYKWCGKFHHCEKCRSMPCFKNWLGYAYLKWETSGE